jgi:predicted DNA-binding protein (UPF0251 family)/predicted Fe-Mo cluster-binding NifX family protein
MVRPVKKRRICCEPSYEHFSPYGIPSGAPVTLSFDEYEAIRLIDYEKMTQAQCAVRMDVSRPTIASIYESARHKIADCLVNGNVLQISGGNYRLCSGHRRGCGCVCPRTIGVSDVEIAAKGVKVMRIAVTYDNGNVFQHFGHTEAFKVYDVENQQIQKSQIIPTNGSGHGALAGFLRDAGVDALICGGIGGGAQNALAQVGVNVYGGVVGNTDEAVAALISGTLNYQANVQCNHHDQACEGGEHAHGGQCCHN